ncbi:TetR family transcriptional regulator [Sphingobacterium hungaricum]|uniref:Biofilm operon icaADBC HTH-type negative transcriptional regulator IcaR n=1 Tax=Sphingobacterium hungaricum TaxID=2082723 RepID=A0A928UW69_9SPHI|nr:TetR family transcriptional regulator [Sphingobacterium hungaricum]MBE8712641.1 TetR family transcriptional regulator [Sphingobacterium hungaricum]
MGRNSLKDERQKEIIQKYYLVAKKEGIENTSIAKIALEMDINPSLIIHYFKNKEELNYALVDFILEKYLIIYKRQNVEEDDLKGYLVELIDKLFSKKWNALFNDSIFYSCYAIGFRDNIIKGKFKRLHDSLRKHLSDVLMKCKIAGVIQIDSPEATADLIYVLVDGAYYYLSLISERGEYENKLKSYKEYAFGLLKI